MKILKFFSDVGKICVFTIVLFIISSVLVSFAISKEKAINPFCMNNFNQIIELDYKEIEKYDYNYSCSTLYFYIEVNENVNKDEILSLVLSIAKNIENKDIFTHFEIISESLNKPLYISINLSTMQISCVGG